MTGTPRIVALVPMRAGSERVKDKNIRLFAGLPLYHHILLILLRVSALAEIVDSPTIIAEAPSLSRRVRIIERPEHLRAGTVPMNDVLLYDVERTEADFYLQTHSTNTLLRAATISKAVEAFLAAR